ncbi:uncharacterized protein LOC141964275 isoform X1 [Athene noctua]|uniref:uncharacterized protein LOC141964275 isoform X1 n=1 Tax=Athene noctua TaxID=126797 RepID=UPI003EB9E42B
MSQGLGRWWCLGCPGVSFIPDGQLSAPHSTGLMPRAGPPFSFTQGPDCHGKACESSSPCLQPGRLHSPAAAGGGGAPMWRMPAPRSGPVMAAPQGRGPARRRQRPRPPLPARRRGPFKGGTVAAGRVRRGNGRAARGGVMAAGCLCLNCLELPPSTAAREAGTASLWTTLTFFTCTGQDTDSETEHTPSKILHYYNASFNRDHPHLLEQCKRRGGRKRRAPEAPEVDERHPASSPDGQPAGDTPASPPALTVPTKRRAESPPSLGSARPSPEAAAPTPPEPAGAAGSAGLTPLGIFLLLSTSSQTPGGLQGAAPAPPLIAVPVLGVAAALEKPPQSQSPAVPHCPTCTCSPSPADAGAAVVPQHGTSWSEHRELAAGQ